MDQNHETKDQIPNTDCSPSDTQYTDPHPDSYINRCVLKFPTTLISQALNKTEFYERYQRQRRHTFNDLNQ